MPRSMTARLRGTPGAIAGEAIGPFALRMERNDHGRFRGWVLSDSKKRIVAAIDSPQYADETPQARRARIDRSAHLMMTLLNRWWRARKRSQPESAAPKGGA